jgi:hypothetical protein
MTFPRALLNTTDHGSNAFLAPSLAFSMWNPFLASALTCSAQVNEGFEPPICQGRCLPTPLARFSFALERGLAPYKIGTEP